MYECIIDGGAVLTQGFGPTNITIEPFCGGVRWHSGYDLAAPAGRLVYANCDGRVLAIGDDPGYGPDAIFIERDQDGLVELYGHLLAHFVQVDQHVMAGEPIGQVGSQGNSTGPHVHFSVRPASDHLTECGSLDPGPYLCTCVHQQPQLPAGPLAPGVLTYSPAAPGLGITWEP